MSIELGIINKKRLVVDQLRRFPSVIVALSGGVDSAVLLALAIEAVGRSNVLAVTGDSPSLDRQDLDDARRVAAQLGARHEVIETRELDRPEYRANVGDRCYHCRTELFERLDAIAAERGFGAVAYGAIADDLGEFRPGMRAADEHRVIAPLVAAGFHKEDVRTVAREAGIEVGDKPASACLASRLPVGFEVTRERLDRVASAERALRGLGFRIFRVRHHGEIARLELDADGMARLGDPRSRQLVAEAIRSAGFRFVAVDLEGYRSGSLNPEPESPLYRIGPKAEGGQ